MKISDILNTNKTSLSFEFFPPKNARASEQLFDTINKLSKLKPSYISVTYGAGGTTRELTNELVLRIKNETDLTVVPHLTCVGADKDTTFDILKTYSENGIENIMALRGDMPLNLNQSNGTINPFKDFKYAVDLVKFIKKHFPNICIGVAGFPEGHHETPNVLKEMDYLKEKVDAGADYICTQLFYDNRYFYDFKERCLLSDINVPVIAGIMPVFSLKNMERIAELALGTIFPAKLLRTLKRAGSDSYNIENAGIHWVAEQVRDLLDTNTKGIHFYTLNKWDKIQRICTTLGIKDSFQFR